MELDPSTSNPREFYSHMVCAITPRPIAWVSTVSDAGVANLAPFSFFNGAGANPPALMFAVLNNRSGAKKDTLRNIESNGQFVVNVVSEHLAARMNATSAELPPEVSEFDFAAPVLTRVPSRKIRPPRVAESLVSFECEKLQVVAVGDGPLAGNVVVGRILFLHVADSALTDHRIDPAKLDTIGRMGGNAYSRTRDRFDLERP